MLRDKLVEISLAWQEKYGVSPHITSAISEYDAAMLVGMSENEYSEFMKDKTAVNKGFDFVFNGIRYQIKANRPSGKPGSEVTLVKKVNNYDWDKLIWILYDKNYIMQEAWEWDAESYRINFDYKKRLSPEDYRMGINMFSKDKYCKEKKETSLLTSDEHEGRNPKIMYLCITRAFNNLDDFNRDNVYECTRKYWKIPDLQKANDAEFIVGLANGEIKGIYKKESDWRQVKDVPELLDDSEVNNHPEYKARYVFSGKEVESAAVEEDFKENRFRFYGNPIHYNY